MSPKLRDVVIPVLLSIVPWKWPRGRVGVKLSDVVPHMKGACKREWDCFLKPAIVAWKTKVASMAKKLGYGLGSTFHRAV